MTSPTASPEPTRLADDALVDLAVDFLDVMMSAADVTVIGVNNWWPRSRAAITSAAARAGNVRDMVSETTRKLQVENLPDSAYTPIRTIEAALAQPQEFQRWRRIIETDAVYIVLIARHKRNERARNGKKAKEQHPKASTPTTPEEPTF